MADNVTTTTTVSTIPSGTKVATRDVTYSGDASTQLQVVALAVVSGSDDAKTVADVTSSAPLPVTGANGTFPVTDNSGSLTVDNAGTFAVQATIAAGATAIAKAEDVASADADVGVPAMAVRKATPADTSGADGDYEFLQMKSGRLWASATIDAALPAGTNGIGKLTANTGVTIGAVEVAAAQTLATVTTVATVTDITNQGQLVDNAAFTDGTTRLNMAGFIYDESAGTALTENDAAAARIDVKRAVVMVVEDATTRGQRQSVNSSGGASVTPIPHTSGGLTTYHLVSAASTNLVNVKNAAGQLYGWYVYNSNAAARKLCFHNSASAPTAGASIFFSIVIPPSAGANVEFSHGIAFSTGISISTVTGLADSDTAAVALNDLIINLFYK